MRFNDVKKIIETKKRSELDKIQLIENYLKSNPDEAHLSVEERQELEKLKQSISNQLNTKKTQL